ncbi:DUF2478 domain-containing protein [Aliiroseovarius crassostreae]|uniref:DUF2478 domain-containing protein n=1 Tax=Aliiroseovarius crassostreae TaxID=154981 RepID=UPI0028832100|nr:DUF2478 domain-containing protein [Aliiroseovarius crassostreae]
MRSARLRLLCGAVVAGSEQAHILLKVTAMAAGCWIKPRTHATRGWADGWVLKNPRTSRELTSRQTDAMRDRYQDRTRKMKLAYVIAPGRGKTNELLAGVADALGERGLRLAGTVQLDTERAEEFHCDMDVLVLPDGPKIRISQYLGANARGCKLNPEALEMAVAATETQITKGADLLIVNKFGKQEAEGRGFRHAVGEALSRDIPAIIGVAGTTVDAFLDYVGDAEELPPEPDALLSWALEATGQTK